MIYQQLCLQIIIRIEEYLTIKEHYYHYVYLANECISSIKILTDDYDRYLDLRPDSAEATTEKNIICLESSKLR
jgi:hypothetical protein